MPTDDTTTLEHLDKPRAELSEYESDLLSQINNDLVRSKGANPATWRPVLAEWSKIASGGESELFTVTALKELCLRLTEKSGSKLLGKIREYSSEVEAANGKPAQTKIKV
jgi:hypothetical protein